jgi:hypothetical protein
MWDALLRFLGFKSSEEAKPRDALEAMGLFVVSDEKLGERLRLLKSFYDLRNEVVALKAKAETGEMTPEEALERLIEYMNAINEMIDKAAVPWWRALDSREASIIMRAWSDINGYFFDLTHTLRNWFRRVHALEEKAKACAESDDVMEGSRALALLRALRPRLPKEILVGAFLSMVIREWLPRAEALVRISWSSVDVTPSWTGVIQPVVQVAPPGPPMRVLDTGSPSSTSSAASQSPATAGVSARAVQGPVEAMRGEVPEVLQRGARRRSVRAEEV